MGLSDPDIQFNPNLTYSKTGSLWGFTTAVYPEFSLSANWRFQPAMQLSFKGYKEINSSYSINEVISYLEFPLNAVYYTKSNSSGFLAGAGPVFSFRTSEDYYPFPTKRVDFGINALIGYQTPIGFSLNLAYTYGFTDLKTDDYYVTKLRNRFATLTVGYLF